MIIEAQTHLYLKEFLKQNANISTWQHHLTMARLVARALRLGRSSLIQTGVPLGDVIIPYRLSYLTPALLWDEPVILVADNSIQNHLFNQEIPHLQKSLNTAKKIDKINKNYENNWQGLLLTSLEFWLHDKLNKTGFFPEGITTIIDGADQLEELTREELTFSINPQNWDELMFSFPEAKKMILNTKVRLTKIVFSHPSNPYDCYLLDQREKQILSKLLNQMNKLPEIWQKFYKQWQKEESIKWVSINRKSGQFSLYCGELEVNKQLSEIWTDQPIVLIGTLLDKSPDANFYRQQLGLPDLTCLQFSIDRQTEPIRLYIPDHIPMPNTPQFQGILIKNLQELIIFFLSHKQVNEFIVIIIGDTPLKAQIAASLAGNFGTRVQVEKSDLTSDKILITGWDFWQKNQENLPKPGLIAMATLPIPSLENPLVAGLVEYYKHKRKDWFRLYLLPTALRELQRAIAPIRSSSGILAILDNRINLRSYGKDVLSALSPFARINYIDGF